MICCLNSDRVSTVSTTTDEYPAENSSQHTKYPVWKTNGILSVRLSTFFLKDLVTNSFPEGAVLKIIVAKPYE